MEDEEEGEGEAMYSVRVLGYGVRWPKVEAVMHARSKASKRPFLLLLLLTETGVPRRHWHLSDVEAEADQPTNYSVEEVRRGGFQSMQKPTAPKLNFMAILRSDRNSRVEMSLFSFFPLFFFGSLGRSDQGSPE